MEKEYFDNNYLLSAIILFTLNPLGIALGIFLNHEADEGGFNDWTGRLSRGEMTRAEVIETGFGQSQEFANILRQYGLKTAE